MVLYICLFQNNIFAFIPEDGFGIKLKASKKLKKMFYFTLCLLFITRLRFPTGKSIAEIIETGNQVNVVKQAPSIKLKNSQRK